MFPIGYYNKVYDTLLHEQVSSAKFKILVRANIFDYIYLCRDLCLVYVRYTAL